MDKQNIYYCDATDSNAKSGDHACLDAHLQIHLYGGKIIRVFFTKKEK